MIGIAPKNYTVNKDTEYPIMMLDKHIGFDEKMGYGINGSDFATEIYNLCDEGAKEITIKINSPGGSITHGMSIYNAILDAPCKINTENIGVAASIAACIFQAGRKRIAYDYSLTMMHNAYSGSDAAQQKVIEKFNSAVCTMLSRKANKPERDIRSMMSKETWLTGAECLTLGFCDECKASNTINMPKGYPKNSALEIWQSINNQLNFTTKTNKMESILNHFSLPESATETEVLAKVSEMENLYKEQVTSAKAEVEALQNKVTDLESALNKIKEEEVAKQAAALEAEAKTFCEKLQKEGKISTAAEALQNSVASYVANPSAFRSIFELAPVNKANGTNIQTEGKAVIPHGPGMVHLELEKIQNKTKNN